MSSRQVYDGGVRADRQENPGRIATASDELASNFGIARRDCDDPPWEATTSTVTAERKVPDLTWPEKSC